jgi:hypothetical protein
MKSKERGGQDDRLCKRVICAGGYDCLILCSLDRIALPKYHKATVKDVDGGVDFRRSPMQDMLHVIPGRGAG